jgi:hypothetical protein
MAVTSRIAEKVADFPDPFASFSNLIYPRTVKDVFEWGEWLSLRHGMYSSAVRKSVRYFMTGIELKAKGGAGVRKKYQDYLSRKANVMDTMATVADDLIFFGNVFTSILVPISRSLTCPKCSSSRPLRNMQKDEDYKWSNWKFTGDCPVCRTKGVEFKREDAPKPLAEEARVTTIRWPPALISIEHCSVSGESDYYFDPPAEVRKGVERGDHIWLATMPWEMIESIKDGVRFKFDKSTFKHLKAEAPATLRFKLNGWGLPPFMSSFNQVVHLMILERYNEAIAMDYIIPFRVLTPPQGTPGGRDPLIGVNLGDFTGRVSSMLKQRRRDPTSWSIMPMPLQYQMLGGEAKQLVPVELMDRALDNLLTSMSVPQEFYRSSISKWGGPPIALRMFERSWLPYTSLFDEWLNWYLGQISRINGWERIEGKLLRTSMYEDDKAKDVKLNLAASKIISQQTALKSFDIDADTEFERRLEEERDQQERLMEMQKEQEAAAKFYQAMAQPPPGAQQQGGQGGQPRGRAGGDPNAQAMANPGGIEDLMAMAEQEAQRIMGLDSTNRRRALVDMKGKNPTLHAQVTQVLKGYENDAAMQGVASARNQAQQAAQPPA